VEKFIAAVNAEGGRTGRSTNAPLHLHPLFNTADIYHHGQPTILANATRDTRQAKGSLPVSESIVDRAFGLPYFKHDRQDEVRQYAAAFRKVALQSDRLR
jgi:dTDP-4-amino-4,6-dideoxygalactose transaminase